jgi:hypothetical protein
MIPSNSAAETIAALRVDSGFYQAQIDKNNALIAQLDPLAEWKEAPEVPAFTAENLPLEESAPESSN